MGTKFNQKSDSFIKRFASKHPILTNLLIIIVIAVLGIWIAYLSLAIFTKHGEFDTVPNVTNMTYTQAIETLNEHGFRTSIQDSVYQENIKPGYVIEQIPKANSNVKPGRKVLLYINAVHPKQVLIDGTSNNRLEFALKGISLRQGKALLEEFGFKNIKEKFVPGTTDRIIRVLANGKPVRMMEKVAINSAIVIEVSMGTDESLADTTLFNDPSIDIPFEETTMPEENSVEETENSEESDIIFIEESAESNEMTEIFE